MKFEKGLFTYFAPEVLKDENLNATERMIFSLIAFLDNEKGCYASNNFIGDFANCSVGTVSKAVSKLSLLGYITNEVSKGGTSVRRVNDAFKKHKGGHP